MSLLVLLIFNDPLRLWTIDICIIISTSWTVKQGVYFLNTIAHYKNVVAWVLKWPREIEQVLLVNSFRVESEKRELFDITWNNFYPSISEFLSFFNKCSYNWLNFSSFFVFLIHLNYCCYYCWFIRTTLWFIELSNSVYQNKLPRLRVHLSTPFTRFCSNQLRKLTVHFLRIRLTICLENDVHGLI